VILLSVFAAVALALAAVGVYGVMSFIVTQRSHEIGIRVALGAGRRDIFGLVLGNGMALLGIGIAIGIASALYLTQLLLKMDLLFQVKPTDIATFVTIPFLLAVVAFVACYVPARRAMRVDPIVALREE
jgi:putative ABC transport system permease protein